MCVFKFHWMFLKAIVEEVRNISSIFQGIIMVSYWVATWRFQSNANLIYFWPFQISCTHNGMYEWINRNSISGIGLFYDISHENTISMVISSSQPPLHPEKLIAKNGCHKLTLHKTGHPQPDRIKKVVHLAWSTYHLSKQYSCRVEFVCMCVVAEWSSKFETHPLCSTPVSFLCARP